MNPQRKRRLLLIIGVLLGIGGAAAAVLAALNQNVQLFFSPSDVQAGKSPEARTFRLGGLVKPGSVRRLSGKLGAEFLVTDCFFDIPTHFTGILPDLFKEGQSVVATGKLETNGIFVAEQVLAKHDETYMPREVAEAMEKAKSAKACTELTDTTSHGAKK